MEEETNNFQGDDFGFEEEEQEGSSLGTFLIVLGVILVLSSGGWILYQLFF